jgi:hypothetical protein
MKEPWVSRSYYRTPRPPSRIAHQNCARGQLDEVPDAAAFAGAGVLALEPVSLEVFVSIFVSVFVSDLVSEFELSESDEDPLLFDA